MEIVFTFSYIWMPFLIHIYIILQNLLYQYFAWAGDMEEEETFSCSMLSYRKDFQANL